MSTGTAVTTCEKVRGFTQVRSSVTTNQERKAAQPDTLQSNSAHRRVLGPSRRQAANYAGKCTEKSGETGKNRRRKNMEKKRASERETPKNETKFPKKTLDNFQNS